MWFLKKIYKYNSKINGTIIVSKKNDKKSLFSGGVTQSGGELVEMWKSVAERIKNDLPDSKNCLVLGVAGGTFISEITKRFPKIQIIGIELDNTMIETYNTHFRDKDSNIIIEKNDATKWIKKSKDKFDIIVVDLYKGKLNPKEARTKSFLINILNSLKSNGVVIYNSHYDKKNNKDYEKFYKRVDDFFKIEVIYEFPLNKLLLLTQRGKNSKNFK